MPTRAGTIRVCVADGDPLVREGLLRAVDRRAALELVGSADDGNAALEQIRRVRPDVALLDVEMAELDGLGVLRAVVRDDLPTRIVFLSACDDSAVVYRALAEGAVGFLPKGSPPEEVCDAIVAVAGGETVLSPAVQGGIANEIRRRTPPRGIHTLSVRENEVLVLVASGLSAPDIGRELHLSPATVKGHLRSLYEKLGVKERAAAVAEAMRRGLLE